MVYITGDIHGNPIRFSNEIFPEQKEMTKNDFVIICGDFGLVWDYHGENKEERYWLDWLDKKPFTTLFVSGNHENYDRLDAYPSEPWNGGNVQKIRPSVLHLMRGEIFSLQGHTFFAFGGASSHDINDGILDPADPDFRNKKKHLDRSGGMYRINHRSWWKRELPDEEEMEKGILNLQKYDNRVNYIITHSPCSSLLKQIDSRYQTDILTHYLESIQQMVKYHHWFFGHMHRNETFYPEHSSCLYEQIIRIL